MPVPTLYLDTSVIGGYHEEEDLWQRKPTRELWRLMELGYVRFDRLHGYDPVRIVSAKVFLDENA